MIYRIGTVELSDQELQSYHNESKDYIVTQDKLYAILEDCDGGYYGKVIHYFKERVTPRGRFYPLTSSNIYYLWGFKPL